jgi:hypothetical protein
VNSYSCYFFASETFEVPALFKSTWGVKGFFTADHGLGCESQSEEKGPNNDDKSSTNETQKVAKSEI